MEVQKQASRSRQKDIRYKDPRWQRKRLECMQRDDWACVACGNNTSTLHAHHIRYMGELWEAPLSELQTLCESCHEYLGAHPKGGIYWETHDGRRVIRVMHCPRCRSTNLRSVQESMWDGHACTACEWTSPSGIESHIHGHALLPPVPRANGRIIRRAYLAGKMASKWRDALVFNHSSPHAGHWSDGHDGVCGGIVDDTTEWPVASGVVAVPNHRAIDFTGPYYIPLGGHGDAAEASEQYPNLHACGDRLDRSESGALAHRQDNVAAKCLRALHNSDLVFAWIDSMDAYGTFAEIGYASSVGCEVWIGVSTDIANSGDIWFVECLADCVTQAASVEDAWAKCWSIMATKNGRAVSNDSCSFCRKPHREVSTLIQGEGASHICDECISLCNDILADIRLGS